MNILNHFEPIEAGYRAIINTQKGFELIFNGIALSPSEDQSNAVNVFITKEGKRALLCVLSEKASIYQISTSIEVEEGKETIFEVYGKGKITLIGITVPLLV